MSDKKNPGFIFGKDKESNKKSPADNNNILKNAQKAGEAIGNKAMEIKGSAMSIKCNGGRPLYRDVTSAAKT